MKSHSVAAGDTSIELQKRNPGLPDQSTDVVHRRFLTPLYWILALVVLGAGCWLRAAHLNDPMRNDEAFSYVSYVKPADYFNYTRPNNHVLNTLLMAVAANVAGDSPIALRFPAFVFGVLVIPAVGMLCFMLCRSRSIAIASMALAASSSVLVEYSVSARGYSFVTLAAVVMACLTFRLKESPGWREGWVMWLFCGVAGLFSVPTMIYVIAPLVLLLLLDRWARVKERLLPLISVLLAMGAAVTLLYVPVVARSGIQAILANPFVAPLPFAAIPADLATRCNELEKLWGTNSSILFVPMICFGTLICIFSPEWRDRKRPMFFALLAIAVAVAMAFAQRRTAPGRAYCYLLAWMISFACAGAAQFLEHLPRWKEGMRKGVAVIFIGVAAIGFFKVERQKLLISEDPHTYVEARQVAAELVKHGVFGGHVSLGWDLTENIWPPLLYYLVQMHPKSEGHFVSWNDPQSKAIFILIYRSDNIEEFLRSRPGLVRIYSYPAVVQETANSRIYLAARREPPPP